MADSESTDLRSIQNQSAAKQPEGETTSPVNSSEGPNKKDPQKSETGGGPSPSEGLTSDTKKEEKQPSASGDVENPKKDDEEPEVERAVWDNQIQFILTCIGLAVGLGNIWKFPYLAYENGGSAFLFPYITCAFVFGLPMVYAEFLIGQYARASPPEAFRAYAPAFQGLGWAMALMSATVAIYYTTIIAWAGVYMFFIVAGRMTQWTSCDNEWNTPTCISPDLNDACVAASQKLAPFQNPNVLNLFNTTSGLLNCTTHTEGMMGASEEFFTYFLTRRSDSVESVTGMNLHMVIALSVMWLIITVILIKGIKFMGYTAYVTSTLPYLIVAILFVRGVTLPHAVDGIIYYLGQPDFSKVLKIETWTKALTQICFSISIGYGGLITLSSYSKFSNNIFRDSLIVICGDTFMSVFGGVAVFSTIGYLAHKNGKSIEDTVSQGTALAFIVYPEAISLMPFPEVLAMLFFLMLFCLGISSEVALVEILCTCIYDQFRSTRRRKWAVVLGVCGTFFLIAFIMATDAGIYWFNIYNEFCGSTAGCVISALEILILAYLYGRKNAMKDVEEMLGPASKNWFCRVLGHMSPYWGWSWMTACPILAIVVGAMTCIRQPMKYADGSQYPLWCEFLGWFLSMSPLLAIPVFFFINLSEFKKEDRPVSDLFKIQKELRSYNRIMAEKNGGEKENLKKGEKATEPQEEQKAV